jgi:hypothetical protein
MREYQNSSPSEALSDAYNDRLSFSQAANGHLCALSVSARTKWRLDVPLLGWLYLVQLSCRQ